MNAKEHWESVYRSKQPTDVSWYQVQPSLSLDLIARAGLRPTDGIIDVGGGASVLVDRLLDAGYENLAVLDISGAALAHAQERLGARAQCVEWYEADVREFSPPHRYALWHDRAVFHFLTGADDRAHYVQTLKRTLRSGGSAVIATFAADGPKRCSGLDVVRHDAASVRAALGPGFSLVKETREVHVTPWQTEQHFAYFRFTWNGGAA